MIGTIESANTSQSGKTLSVKIGGAYYSSKNWELQGMVGQEIVFEPSPQVFPDGSSIQWLNDYQPSNMQTTPAGQAMNQAMGANVAPPAGQAAPLQSPAPNKDSVIGAMALAKACPGTPEQVWENFVFFYNKLNGWDHTVPY
jgi:hypothetical protein